MSDSRKRRQTTGLRNRTGSGENLHRSSPHNSRPKMNSSQGKTNFQRQTSYDRVRKIVQEEGRAARNLLSFNVPLDEYILSEKGNGEIQKKPQTGSRQQTGKPQGRSLSVGKVPSSKCLHRDATPPSKKLSPEDGSPKIRGRTSSQGTITPKKKDLRARYWAFLFENLKRAVDEIYVTCEQDESVVECREVIMMLEQCTRDFKTLIEKLNVIKAFENAEEGKRPTSLAWEIRKSSPGKSLNQSGGKEQFQPSPTVSRTLNFSQPHANQRMTAPGNSWADKVKASPPQYAKKALQNGINGMGDINKIDVEIKNTIEEEDTEGWETVQRKDKTKSRNLIPLTQGSDSKTQKRKKNQRPDSLPTSPVTYKDAPLSSGKKEHFDSQRNRTDSRDSEKENRPISDADSLGTEISKRASSSCDVKPKETKPFKSAWEDINAGKSPPEKQASITSKSSKGSRRSHQSVRSRSSHDGQTSSDQGASPSSSEGEDTETEREEDDVDALTSKIESVLVSVMDEEDNLTNQLVREQNAALESAIQQEENYLKEIAREQSLEIMVDTEPDTESELGTTMSSTMSLSLDWDSMLQQYDEKEKCSWGDMAEDETESRTPGRVVHMHEKLSSPSRKRSPTESRKRHEEKQAKAQELRERLLTDKADRLRTLTAKVEEVRAYKDELLDQRRNTMERKLQRAEEKRMVQLQQKVRKAHDEEAKLNEIAFINSLEAQNKKHDIQAKHQESEARLQDLQEERQRRNEEKAAKEAAVEERRKALEAERLARLHEMQERRRQKEADFELRQLEKEKEKLECVRIKEKEREERMSAINAQQQQHIEDLQKKIQQKQNESALRHKENLKQIREKAFEMSVLRHSTEDHNDAPNLVPYDRKKFCTVCNVMISSEVYLLSHLRGKMHQKALKDSNRGKELSKQEIEAFNLKNISDAPSDKPDLQITSDKERQKAHKKRCKKLRQRMAQRGTEYEGTLNNKQPIVESEHRAKLQKIVKDLNKYIQTQGSGPWPQNRVSALDRALGEISRIMEKKVVADQNAFRTCGGLTTLNRVLLVIGDTTSNLPCVVPTKSIVHVCTVFRLACKGCYDNCHYLLFSNKIGSLIDLLVHQLNLIIPDNFGTTVLSSSGGATSLAKLPYDPMSTSLMQIIATILNCLAKHNPSSKSSEASAERMSSSGDAFLNRANDIISYIISVGVADKLTNYFSNIRGPIDNDLQAAEFLQHSMALLTSMTKLISTRSGAVFDKKKVDDNTQLISTFKCTELVGIVSLMYGMLLHSGAPERGSKSPPELPQHTLTITNMGMKMLNNMALLDLTMLQGSLGEEGTSLEFRHIASYLLWYCSHWTNAELLHEVILCVGYFTAVNADNQVIIQSGQPPTVLQQLCSLPFQYFSDSKLTGVLFPTLIACCYNSQSNRVILEQELSCELLANFIEEKTLEAQQAKLSAGNNKKTKTQEKEADSRMSFPSRFPQNEWEKAKAYFKS